jgi:hypothetical protein
MQMNLPIIDDIITFTTVMDSPRRYGYSVNTNKDLRKVVIEYFKLDKTKFYTVKLQKYPKGMYWKVKVFNRKARRRKITTGTWTVGPMTFVGKMPIRKDLEIEPMPGDFPLKA